MAERQKSPSVKAEPNQQADVVQNAKENSLSPLEAGGARAAGFLQGIAARIGAAATRSPEQEAALVAQKEERFKAELTAKIQWGYDLDLQYVRHHQPVDDKTRKGHFLKAGAQEFFWDPKKQALLAWNAGAKKWEAVLPKRDEVIADSFMESPGVKQFLGEIGSGAAAKAVKDLVSGKSMPFDYEATTAAANELREGLKRHGGEMELLDPVALDTLLRKEAIIDAIANICKKKPENWTSEEAKFVRTTGLDPEEFLKLCEQAREPRANDALAQQRHNENRDATAWVSFHRRHMVENILDNSFSARERKVIRRENPRDEMQVLEQHFKKRGLAI
jgi:hypothetical protein